MSFPYIDPDVKFIGISKLREFNSDKLKENKEITHVICEGDEPLAVILNYNIFLRMQDEIKSLTKVLNGEK